jgi:DNA polymerase-1
VKLLSSDAIRRCLIADPGKVILSADFDQVELRVAAALAGETILIEAAKRGDSLHKTTAIELFGIDFTADQYRYAKNVTFGWLFGGGAGTLSEQAGIPFAQAQDIVKRFTTAYRAMAAYKRREQERVLRTALSPAEYKQYRKLLSRMFDYRSDTREGVNARKTIQAEIRRLCYRKQGYAITPFGRRLIVDAEKPYTVVNYVVQSTARDIMATALLRVMDDPELEPTVLLPIHDELLGQAPRSKAEYIAQRYGEVMSTEFMEVPITATGKVYGKSWGHGYRASQ